MDDGGVFNAFFEHAPLKSALQYKQAEIASAASSSKGKTITLNPGFASLHPATLAYLTMTTPFWPTGTTFLPQWTPINGRTGNVVTNQISNTAGADVQTKEACEVAEAAALRADLWNDRLRTAGSALLRDTATWRPAESTRKDNIISPSASARRGAARAQAAAIAINEPTDMTDEEILSGGVKRLHGRNLIQVACTHRNTEISHIINERFGGSSISSDMVGARLRRALDKQAQSDSRPRAEIKQELDDARKRNGVFKRKQADVVSKAKATKSTKRMKSNVESPSKTLEMFGFGKITKSSSASSEISPVEDLNSDEDPLGDLEEMGRRVAMDGLPETMHGNKAEPTAIEKQVLKDFRSFSNGSSTSASTLKPYEYDRDGDTTDEEPRALQIARVEQRKRKAKVAARTSASQSRSESSAEG